jgi:hypothetical protein
LGLYPRAAIAKGAHCDFKKVLGYLLMTRKNPKSQSARVSN